MSISLRQRGLTLIELIIFIVIVGVAVVGILQVITLNTRNSADPARRKQAMAIAEGLMEEVRSASFTFCDINDPLVETATDASACFKPSGSTLPPPLAETPGPEATNTRPFDNINDYVSAYGAATSITPDITSSGGSGNVSVFPAGYAASITITPDSTLGPAGAPLSNNVVLRILVKVSYGADKIVLEGLRTQYAPNNVPISPRSP